MKIRFTNHDMAELDPPRDLTAHERSVMHKLVDITPDAEPARCQIEHARVSAECTERCGTIELVVPTRECPTLSLGRGPLAEGEWHAREELAQTVLLFCDAGVLDYLETYRHNGEVPGGLPPAEDLTTWKARERSEDLGTFEVGEPRRFRFMRLGLPLGLGLFLVLVAWLATGTLLQFGLVIVAMTLVVAYPTALVLLTAYRMEVHPEVLRARTPLREISIPWEEVEGLEMIDRRDLAYPRRLLRVKSKREQVFVFDSVDRFDELVDAIVKQVPEIKPRGMPLWKRIVFLQWGV